MGRASRASRRHGNLRRVVKLRFLRSGKDSGLRRSEGSVPSPPASGMAVGRRDAPRRPLWGVGGGRGVGRARSDHEHEESTRTQTGGRRRRKDFTVSCSCGGGRGRGETRHGESPAPAPRPPPPGVLRACARCSHPLLGGCSPLALRMLGYSGGAHPVLRGCSSCTWGMLGYPGDAHASLRMLGYSGDAHAFFGGCSLSGCSVTGGILTLFWGDAYLIGGCLHFT